MNDDKRYACITCDPPWNERGSGKIKRGADRHYPLLKTHEIVETIIQSPLWRPADNSHLWMWCTVNFLPDALDVIKALGYRYKTHAVWVKARETLVLDQKPHYTPERPGLGQYLRYQHELLLLSVRGRLRGQARNVPSVIFAPRGAHSEKPEGAYNAIGQVSPGPRAELFATGPRPGWDCWGQVSGVEHNWSPDGCIDAEFPDVGAPFDEVTIAKEVDDA
jgi:N6-adenosine-specific RNA methylase IME4